MPRWDEADDQWGQVPGQIPLFGEQYEQGSFEFPETEHLTSGGIPIAASTGEFGASDFDAIPIYEDEEQARQDATPASISVVPTSTTNPARPRTVAAGYSRHRKTMTVIFRDGTWWNYYDVPVTMWTNFKRAYSKGWFLHASGMDEWPTMGPASVSMMTPLEHEQLSTYARAVQTHLDGLQKSGQRTAHMDRLLKQDQRIKKNNVRTHNGRISNPYYERTRTRKRRLGG